MSKLNTHCLWWLAFCLYYNVWPRFFLSFDLEVNTPAVCKFTFLRCKEKYWSSLLCKKALSCCILPVYIFIGLLPLTERSLKLMQSCYLLSKERHFISLMTFLALSVFAFEVRRIILAWRTSTWRETRHFSKPMRDHSAPQGCGCTWLPSSFSLSSLLCPYPPQPAPSSPYFTLISSPFLSFRAHLCLSLHSSRSLSPLHPDK